MTFHSSNTTILFELSFDIQMLKLLREFEDNSKKTKETTERDCGIRGMKRHYAMVLFQTENHEMTGCLEVQSCKGKDLSL